MLWGDKILPFFRFLPKSLKLMRPHEPIFVTFSVSYYALKNLKLWKTILLWKTTKKIFRTRVWLTVLSKGVPSFYSFSKKYLICFLFNISLLSVSDYEDNLWIKSFSSFNLGWRQGLTLSGQGQIRGSKLTTSKTSRSFCCYFYKYMKYKTQYF